VGKCVAIHNNIYFFDFGKFQVGDHSTINNGCYIDNRFGVEIGRNVNISHDCKIYTMGHDINNPHAKVSGGKVVIKDNVWIFPNCLIMPNVTIEKGAVIYPGSLVTKSVGEYEIVGGTPAKVINKRNVDIQYKLKNRVWFAK
jgi:acetyltransferase-like isoleucine patch superfamily enzyme